MSDLEQYAATAFGRARAVGRKPPPPRPRRQRGTIGVGLAYAMVMLSCSRRCSTVLAALSLAGEVWGAGCPARASYEGNAEVGTLTGVELSEVTLRPTVGVNATRWWTPASGLELGLQGGLGITVIPYGRQDGEPVLGMRGYEPPYPLNNSVTFMPRVMFGPRLALSPRIGLGASVGTTFLMSGAHGMFSLIPLPVASVALDIKLREDRLLGLRAAFSYIILPWDTARGFLAPTLALRWN